MSLSYLRSERLDPIVRPVRYLNGGGASPNRYRLCEIGAPAVSSQSSWESSLADRCDLKVRPHFKYMGAPFTLSVVGLFDRG